MRNICCAYLVLNVLSSLEAAQIKNLQREKRIECVISDTQINRIQIEGDRIAAVYGGDNRYAIETDEVGGQIFLKAAIVGNKDHLYLTLLTEGEVTQDVKLVPGKVDAQTVIFKADLDLANTLAEENDSAVDGDGYTHQLLRVIKDLAEARGDGAAETNADKWVGQGTLEILSKETRFTAGFFAQTVAIKNRGKDSLALTPEVAATALEIKPLAVAAEKFELLPGEKTNVFVILRIREQGR